MIRSVVVWLPSGNDVLIRPRLAQVLLPGFANESLMLCRTPEMIALAIDDYVVAVTPRGGVELAQLLGVLQGLGRSKLLIHARLLFG